MHQIASHAKSQPDSKRSGTSSTATETRRDAADRNRSEISNRVGGCTTDSKKFNAERFRSSSPKTIAASFPRSIIPPSPTISAPKCWTKTRRVSERCRTSRAITSASIQVAPESAKVRATVDLPPAGVPTSPRTIIVGCPIVATSYPRLVHPMPPTRVRSGPETGEKKFREPEKRPVTIVLHTRKASSSLQAPDPFASSIPNRLGGLREGKERRCSWGNG